MAFATFEQDIFIAATPDSVRGFLKEMNNRLEMHPLIISIQHTNTAVSSDGTQIDYFRIRDRIKLGPLTLHFTYRANISLNAVGEFVADAYQSPGIHLHNITTCQVEGDGSRVKEFIEITAPRLLMKTTYAETVSSHKKMLANLKKIVETEQPTIPQ